MNLRSGDRLVGLDILPSDIVANLGAALETDASDDDTTAACEDLTDTTNLAPNTPWMLIVTAGGYGKRVPVSQFRLQNRAGMGIVATKFRKPGDRMAALRIVNGGDELMMITNRGIIIRQSVDAISCQSRPASGVRLQRLDEDDEIVAATIIPVSTADEDGILEDSSPEGDTLDAIAVEIPESLPSTDLTVDDAVEPTSEDVAAEEDAP